MLFASKLTSCLKEVWFAEQEFLANLSISKIKYNHPESQNDNIFYPFNNQLDYALAYYFTNSEITKGNIDKFMSNSLIALFTKKLSYQNANKRMEKLSKITWGIPNNE